MSQIKKRVIKLKVGSKPTFSCEVDKVKENDYKITIPYRDYLDFIKIKNDRDYMLNEIRACFDTSCFDIDNNEPITFRRDVAINNLKKFLSYKYKTVAII